MKKMWLIARTTYKRRVRSSTFLLMTLGLPLLMITAGAVPILRETGGELTPVGYVDQTEALAPVSAVTVEDETLDLRFYTDVDTARAGVAAGEIDGYMVVPADYLQDPTARPTFYGKSDPGARLEEGLTHFLQQALAPDAPAWMVARLQENGRVTYIATATGDVAEQGPGLVVRVATPAVLGLLFGLVIYTTISQMGTAMVQEKEQRSMEMILTSLRPRELAAGKVLGMGLVSLTQIAIWLAAGSVAGALALTGRGDLTGVRMPWRPLTWAALLGGTGYMLYAVLAAGLGIVAGNRTDARQFAGRLGFIGLAPLYLMGLLAQQPDGPLAVVMTLFPLTSPIFTMFRMVLTDVPTWQLVTALGLLAVSFGAALWALGRVFRASILLYGQTLTLRQIWQTLRRA